MRATRLAHALVVFCGALFLLFAATGCALFGGLRVEPVATSAQRPSNVAVYLTVEKKHEAVTGLTEENFRIYEDGQLLPRDQTQQTLLPRDVAAVHRTLLLVDMSGGITEGDLRERISRAAAHFVTTVRVRQAVTVYAFDGGTSIRQIAEFSGEGGAVEIPELASYTSQDASSNLNAAVVQALEQLDVRLMQSARPLRIGTLVVFTRGPDLAGRVTEDALRDAVEGSDHHVFAIGVTESQYRPSSVGKSDVFMAETLSTIDGAFEEAANRTADKYEQYFLISYCSPARAGKRLLRVEVVTADNEGEEISGKLNTEFDSEGFASGCDPKATPRFVVTTPPADEEEEAAEDDADAESTKTKRRSTPPPSTPPPSPPPPAEGEDDEVVPPPDKPGYAQ